MSKQTTTVNFNYNEHVSELIGRFDRLISQLGPNNRKDWSVNPPISSTRYQFEVDFMYALRAISSAPAYLQGKMFDNANGVVNALANHIRHTIRKSEELEGV